MRWTFSIPDSDSDCHDGLVSDYPGNGPNCAEQVLDVNALPLLIGWGVTRIAARLMVAPRFVNCLLIL